VGMIAGRKIIKIEASKPEDEEKVLLGEAEVEQPVSSYVFTGQGSQEQGMGMDLYNSSEVAKEVWDRADKHFMDNYGKLSAISCPTRTLLTLFKQASQSQTLSRTIQRSSPFTLVALVARPSARTICL
jgi:malonyl CoA-acyl carrier protein transacylase